MPERAIPAPFSEYEIGTAYDEMFRANGRARQHYKALYSKLLSLPSEELMRSKQEADLSFFNQGITFTVYGRDEGTEDLSHDLFRALFLPRSGTTVERGLTQRITALNLFLKDIYNDAQDSR
jgi:uncharacterized circularly permuted ATP-grasp superfamily protein